jgi:thioester reductase-like protein
MAESNQTPTASPEALDEAVVSSDVLLTGFPGFLATRLMKELLAYQEDATFHFLVQSKHRNLAEQRLGELAEQFDAFQGRWEVHEGDITDPLLGFEEDTYDELTSKVGVVWHLAAIYDLAVPEKVAYQVNVSGTIHVLDFCESCENFERLNYISTCYVAGERRGMIYEDELDEGQGHKNHYESTKFWAEVEVQRRWDQIPTVVFRPGIVVGDSTTGETDKYDGPYYLFKLMRKLPDWMPMVNIGKGETVVNIVPVNFVAESMAYLGLKAGTDEQVYQLADPNPMRSRDIVALLLDCMNKAPAVGSIPTQIMEWTLSNPKIEQLVGVPEETIIYFNHDARFDSSNTQRELEDTPIRCPHLSTYMQTLVDYFLRNPEKSFLDERAV